MRKGASADSATESQLVQMLRTRYEQEAGCKLKVNHTYAVCPGRGKHAIGRVCVTDTRLEPIGFLSDAEAVREGFADAAAFEHAFVAINGGTYDPSALVWRVEFAVVPAEDLALWEQAA